MPSDKYRPFARGASTELIEKLKAERLFDEKLWRDVMLSTGREHVFPAVREEQIDFYHRNGLLLSYDGKAFSTHRKHASVFDEAESCIRESNLPLLSISKFMDGYEEMKRLCDVYSGAEDQGIAELCSRFSYAASTDRDKVVVLDIEVSFAASARDGEGSQDRIDLVLLSRAKKHLMFVEAKTLANPNIAAARGFVPKVVPQVDRYREQLTRQRPDILRAYTDYVRVVNELFGSQLPAPIEVVEDVPLLIFDFDADQKKGRLKERIKPMLEENGVTCLTLGKLKDARPSTLVKWFSEAAGSRPRPGRSGRAGTAQGIP